MVRYFERNPNTRFSKSHIINVATAKMKVSPESVGRRLRVLAEVSEWGYRPNVDTPEHESGHKLLDGGKVIAERIGGYVHYTYQPPKTRKQRVVDFVGNKAVERWVEEPTV